MTLPADVSRCANPDCWQRMDCERAVPPQSGRVVWITFPTVRNCEFFIPKDDHARA